MCIRYTLQITIIGITLWAINIPPRNVDISQNYSRVNNNALHVHVVKEVMAIQNLSQLERHGVYHTWNVQIVKLPLIFLQHSNCYQSLHNYYQKVSDISERICLAWNHHYKATIGYFVSLYNVYSCFSFQMFLQKLLCTCMKQFPGAAVAILITLHSWSENYIIRNTCTCTLCI